MKAEKLDKLAIENFSGTFAMFEGLELVKAESYKFANKMFRVPNSPELAYGTASCTKGFTSTAILILVTQGKLKLADPIKNYLGERKWLSKNMTIEALLTHTSGVADYFDESVMSDFAELWKDKPNYSFTKPDDFLSMIDSASESIVIEENGKFKYSNSGFVLLAIIVEKISGLSFTEFVTKNIFEPAGMKRSGFFRFDETPNNELQLATGYCADGKSNIYSLPVIGGGDGGAFVCVLDMPKFWAWFEQGAPDKSGNRQISADLLEKAWHPQATEFNNDIAGDSYGYGFWIQKDNPDLVMLQGFDPGVCFLSFYNRKTKRNMTIAQNDETTTADEIFENYFSFVAK